MFGAVSRTVSVLLRSAVFILATTSFVAPSFGAESCKIEIDGTKKSKDAPCVGSLDDLIKVTTGKITLRAEKGLPAIGVERTALINLVSALQSLLSVNASTFAKDRIELQTAHLNSLLTTYHRSILKEPDQNLDPMLKKLSRELFTWIAGSKTGSISETAKELNFILTDPDYQNAVRQVFTVGTPNEFESLIDSILGASKTNSTAALIAISKKLSAFIKDNQIIDANNDVLYEALFTATGNPGALIDHLDTIENKRVASAADRRAKSLTDLLDKAFEPEKDPTPEQIKEARIIRGTLNTVDTVTALSLLRDQIDGLTGAGGPKIHILYAWFGHIGQRWSQGNQCSATSAMRARCERKANCATGDTAGQTINAKGLCGFDPAPVARGKARGLMVRYSCETGGGDFWDELARKPLINPDTEGKYKKTETRTVVLRSTTMKLSCSFPIEKSGEK